MVLVKYGEVMLGWVLAFMAYDTAKTLNSQAENKKRSQEIKNLQFRLKRPMTRGHDYQCKCRLCYNRRQSAVNRLNELIYNYGEK